tara:strand:+ start:4032 stop:4346 length:315 start_codon:yes stop_codon:yes gene_type:complete
MAKDKNYYQPTMLQGLGVIDLAPIISIILSCTYLINGSPFSLFASSIIAFMTIVFILCALLWMLFLYGNNLVVEEMGLNLIQVSILCFSILMPFAILGISFIST